MLNFEYNQPTNIIFGKDTQKEAGKHIKPYGKNVLIVYGSERIKETGLLDTIIASLQQSKIDYTLLGGVLPNPRLSKVYEGIKICKEKNIDFVLAVGGGSAIDSAKGIAVGALYSGDVWDLYINKDSFNDALPIGTVLTIAAAGSEASTGSVLTNEKTDYKRAINAKAMIPRFSILNPALTISVSPYQTACGCTDIMMHVIERYFTPTNNVAFTDRLCEAVLLTIIEQAPIVLEKPTDYDARAEIMWAGTIAHNNLLSTGRIGDWASHRIGMELSAIYDTAHGATLAIICPSWMRYVYKHDIDRFYQFATRVMGVDASVLSKEEAVLKGIDALEAFFYSLGMPTRMSMTNIDDSNLEIMAEKSQLLGEVGNFVKLNKDDVLNIYKMALK